ncbi:hypothetical protein GCM10025860_05370 [Methanobacterium ferruginis]|nr:hypothetical protein GCM10025860_05370 [Methanobacterium ferruginis]
MDLQENINRLDQDLRIIARRKGVDFYGVADLSLAQNFIREQGVLKLLPIPGAFHWVYGLWTVLWMIFPIGKSVRWLLTTVIMVMKL